MIKAVESYLALRRAAGFSLSNTEYLLRSFAQFAGDRQERYIRTPMAIEWANEGPSIAQRHTRYQTICRFSDYVRLEDPRHDGPTLFPHPRPTPRGIEERWLFHAQISAST